MWEKINQIKNIYWERSIHQITEIISIDEMVKDNYIATRHRCIIEEIDLNDMLSHLSINGFIMFRRNKYSRI